MLLFFGTASDMGPACRIGTCLPGPLGMPVLLRRLGDRLSRGGARVPLASHEGEHTETKDVKKVNV